MIVRIAGVAYCCGTCALWRRSVGCTMPATPATVNCGQTRFIDLCEQHTPSHAQRRIRRRWKVRKRPTELARFQAKITTAPQRALRIAHYQDGAILGYD